ncbi:DUF2199 domain-containing protein [Paenibacillus sp. 19GGS1-52]|uniref:DUF2199 domain-containing protein n=1 Tax=Paenibacillus sp. 19GGS1-52 TaxID=2758563 RepID=UPI001EFA9844|nr:DUF2199 domain-containing protein [Paenibacillus sp. 19GGS1-52]ULO08504.1 DUF2199 domain-containing protein [Paenibacillus sp. 19GGS1-52]
MKCSHCNEEIGELSLFFGSKTPYHYLVLDEAARQNRCEINKDLCVIDQNQYFIRGDLEIPILGTGDIFIWSVWSSISECNFTRVNDLWNSTARQNESAYFGWFSTQLPIYPNTLNLKCEVQTREVGVCPKILLESTDHPLAIEQRKRITMERVHEINHLIGHETK